jgi:putative PIG3 family NAD(P)H quinone oxidoreductase
MAPFSIPATMTEVAISSPGGPEVLRPRSVPTPVPGEGDLLVRVMAAGVNRPDVLQRKGLYPMPPGVTPTPGLEIAGEVVATGAAVAGFAIGDRVFGLTNGGGYAEYCLLPAGQALPMPGNVTALQAAAIPETLWTVWANLFQMGRAQRGESVLVHGGTSGIGSMALMLTREFGLRAISTDSGPEKSAAALRFGAERSINYREQDFATEVLAWTAGRGVDVIVDIVGAKYLERNIACLAKDGRLIFIGFLGGSVARELDLFTVIQKRATLTGSTMRSRTPVEKAAITNDLRKHVLPVLAAGRCLPEVHAVFRLDEVAEAHRLMESGRHIGKIVLRVTD